MRGASNDCEDLSAVPCEIELEHEGNYDCFYVTLYFPKGHISPFTLSS
jgi:hypothetical protein